MYQTSFPWYIEPPTHGNLTPIIYWTHGISNPLSMVYWTSYPWYIESPTHGISNALPTVNWTPLLWYYEPPFLVKMRGFNLPWWSAKYYDGNLIPESKYHMVYWTSGRFFRGSKYHMTPDQLRDIYSIYRCFWNVAIHVTCLKLKQQVHTNSLNILGTVVVVIVW